MNFASLPDRRAALDPDGAAVSDGRQSLTNTQLLDRVRAAARQLQDLGIGPGDVVALKLTNRIEFVLLLFAAWRIGATITPVNPSMTNVEVDRQVKDSGARLLVVEDHAAPVTDGTAVLAVGALYKEGVRSDHAPYVDSSAFSRLFSRGRASSSRAAGSTHTASSTSSSRSAPPSSAPCRRSTACSLRSRTTCGPTHRR
jgi:long-chain acyl-CoA synthetase